VIADPPSSGAAHFRDTDVAASEVTTMSVGAAGVVEGVADAVVDGIPAPTAFKAATLNMNEVPRARPVTVIDVEVETGSVNLVQTVPFVEYSAE